MGKSNCTYSYLSLALKLLISLSIDQVLRILNQRKQEKIVSNSNKKNANADQGNINASQKKNKEGKQDNQADKKKGQDDALESGARQGNRQQDSKLSSQQR